MSNLRKCNPDKCPPENLNSKYVVECYSCHEKSHLPCYDIPQPVKKVFFQPNIVFVCDECIADKSPARKLAKQARSLVQSTLTPVGLSNSGTPSRPLGNEKGKKSKADAANFDATNNAIANLTSQIAKHTEQLKLLTQSVEHMDETVQDSALKQQESALKQHETFASVVASAVSSKPTYQPVFLDETLNLQKPSTSADVNRANLERTLDAAHKLALKNRTLVTGTIETSEHCLGKAVQPQTQKLHASNPTNNQRVNLPKSIYVSRLETSVKADDIVSYITKQTPNIDPSHISVRLLVKRDQDLKELTFVSFRLSCTEDLYDSLISPSFWPQHVRIGVFFEQQKQQQPKKQLGNFVSSRINELNKSSTTSDLIELEQQNSASKNDSIDPPITSK